MQVTDCRVQDSGACSLLKLGRLTAFAVVWVGVLQAQQVAMELQVCPVITAWFGGAVDNSLTV